MIAFSAVIPMYRVERYLPALLDSFTAQRPGDYRVEYIFVDDGSPDAAAAQATEWLERHDHPGRVISQANSGVGAARTAGLRAATGTWVTFPDPDDTVAANYFSHVAGLIGRWGPRATMLSTRLKRIIDPDPRVRDVHALRFRFQAGDRIVNMDQYPDFFQLNVASAFFRRSEIADLSFHTDLHASEDALFVAETLLRQPVRNLGLAAGTAYNYRKRQTKDSAVDRFRSDPNSYVTRFADGYLPLLARAAESGGVPEWLQSMFLYECQWLFPVQMTPEGYAHSLDAPAREQVRTTLGACARYVTEERLFRYDATALPLESRLVIQALADRALPPWIGVYRDRDPREAITFSTVPAEVQVGPAADDSDAHVRSEFPDYFGQEVLRRLEIRSGQPIENVTVNAVPRPVVARRRGETQNEQLDRHRRVMMGQLRGAVLARARDVRVRKPIGGPRGSIWAHTRWQAFLATLRLRRWLGRRVRSLRG